MSPLFEQLNFAKKEEENAKAELDALHQKGETSGVNVEKAINDINLASNKIETITQRLGQIPRE